MNKAIFQIWRGLGLDPVAVINHKFPKGKKVKGFRGAAVVSGYDGKFTANTGQIIINYLTGGQDIITVKNLVDLNA